MNRLHDWLHERRIAWLKRRYIRAMDSLDHYERMRHWERFSNAIKARSPAQVERMERARGIR